MDAKFFELDSQMESLRAKLAAFPSPLTRDYQAQWLYRGPKGGVR